MLRSLNIINYALIDNLEIEFSRGLTTITGETGAGKSILLGALSLILGSRADTQVLRNKDLKCMVEGCFDHDEKLLNLVFSAYDLEIEDTLILRREISPNGKSRAFVNDTPVNLPVLREIGLKLVDIHSQHENLELGNNLYQLMVVDAFAGLNTSLDEYSQLFASWKQTKNELSVLQANAAKAKAEMDFLSFQFNELESAMLVSGEQEELEAELEILKHAEEIKSGLYTAWQHLAGEEGNSISLLKSAEAEILRIKAFHKPSEELRTRLEAIIIELRDIAAEAESMGEKVALDPSRLQWVQDRLNLIYSLQQKYRLKTMDELITFRENVKESLNNLSTIEFRMEELEKELGQKKNLVVETATSISGRREKSFPEIEKRIVEILVQLGIPHAQFRILNEKTIEPTEIGFDNIKFLFTANRKTEPQDISRIASGGELSRLMLCIKYIISGSVGLPVIIFDEIDTGVSGEIAFKTGGIMKEMSVDRQVFAISHLPQVAAKGAQHYLVYKDESDAGTTTHVRVLTTDERIVEIARMLSGEQTTVASMENARELLGGA